MYRTLRHHHDDERKTMAMPNTLNERSIADLRIRLMLLDKVIREAQAAKDPRWKEAARQQRAINEVLVRKIKDARREAGQPEPEPVRIGMQPLRLTGKATSSAK